MRSVREASQSPCCLRPAEVEATAASTGTGTNPATGSGTAAISLTDQPACGFDNVYVTVLKVRVHTSAGADGNSAGWTDISRESAFKKIDLLELTNGRLQELGVTPLPAGNYTQVRLVLPGQYGRDACPIRLSHRRRRNRAGHP